MRYLNLISILFVLTSLSIFTNCNKDDDPGIAAENEVNAFIWGAMNSWYYWQEDVDDLKDEQFASSSERNTFLNQFDDPNLLFESLRYADDRFSWITDDYNAQDEYFAGITTAFGFKYGLVRWLGDSVIGYVRYVLPDSPASEVDLIRGELFYGINGSLMTMDNYQELLQNQESYTLDVAKIEDNVLIPTRTTTSFFARQLTENPVFLEKVLEIEGYKIGYLMYNGFRHTFHEQLNDAFGLFKNENVTELVLDLRYNGGGSIYTTMHLASMIYGKATRADVFGKILYNEKHGGNTRALFFVDDLDVVDAEYESVSTRTLNELNIERIYILVSNRSASASELLIAGLLPYMEVRIIGDQTVGKNEGSRTLYDSPQSDFKEKDGNLNSNHTYALQPIISKLANSLDFSDYSMGFLPDIEAKETDYLEFIQPLGADDELLLSIAIDEITGRNGLGRIAPFSPHPVIDEPLKNPFMFEMYLNGISN